MKTDKAKIRVLNQLVAHYGIQYWWEHPNRVHDWIWMILIQRTTEKNSLLAMANLVGYFTANQLLEMPLDELAERIRPAGFNQQKSVYIKELMKWYDSHGQRLDHFQEIATNDIRRELLSIKGGDQKQRMSCCFISLSAMCLLRILMRYVCLIV